MSPLTGTSDAAFEAGVTGTNTNTTPQAGVGVYGKSAAAGVLGENTASWHGVAGIGGPNGGEGLNGVSHSGWAGVGGYNKSAAGGPGVWGIGGATAGEGVHGESNSGYAAVAGYNTNNGPGLWGIGGPHGGEGVHGESHSGFAAVAGYSKAGGPAGWFDGNVVVTGDVILQGADYAEALTTYDSDVTAGSVVVLGEDGEIHLCAADYDRAVAGIVSGAGGVKPALVLDRHDNSAHVALMGKVWCKADATEAPIRPGDLLTTSSIAGHCRAVTEVSRAFGAVIGKALTPLDTGQGMVRVLVSPR